MGNTQIINQDPVKLVESFVLNTAATYIAFGTTLKVPRIGRINDYNSRVSGDLKPVELRVSGGKDKSLASTILLKNRHKKVLVC